MTETAPSPASAPPAPALAEPALAEPAAAGPAPIPEHHLILIAAASAAFFGPGRSITSVTPAPHASRRSSRGGLWPRLVRALTAPIRHHHHQSAQRRTVPGGASAQPLHPERSMKLRIKLENKTYEVEVEPIDSPTLGSAALRVEGSAVAAPSRPASAKAPGRPSEPKPEPKAEPKPEAAAPAPAAPSPGPTPKPAAPPAAPPAKLPDSVKFEPVAPRPPWHGLSVGPGGECTAPVPGIVSAILVKVGDAVKPGDPLIQLEASHVVSPQEKPLAGTLRAVTAGTIAEIPVNRGDPVAFGQVLLRIKTDA